MLLSDGGIKEEIEKGQIKMEFFEPKMLQSASYDMRIGKRLLVSGNEREIDLEKEGSFNLKAGEFALLTTVENITLSNNIVGHIGLKSYYTRKGVIVLAGLQIDPGFSGILILGVYNASSRKISLEYMNPICTVEFHKLAKPVDLPFQRTDLDEQKEALIPKVDRDYLKTLETQSLSSMSESVRQLSLNVGRLATHTKIAISLGVATLTGVVAGFITILFSLAKFVSD